MTSPPSMQAEERQYREDDDHKADEIDDRVHVLLPSLIVTEPGQRGKVPEGNGASHPLQPRVEPCS